VAAGAGRVAVWLALRGDRVTALDVSPRGLELCAARAREAGVEITCVTCDLESEPVPPGPWDVITCFDYLQRDLFPHLQRELAKGGVLACEMPTRTNLERHARPSARFLLEPGELESLCAPLELVYSAEGWSEDRHTARAIARRPG